MRRIVILGVVSVLFATTLWLLLRKSVHGTPAFDPAFHAKTSAAPERLTEGCAEIQELAGTFDPTPDAHGKMSIKLSPLGADGESIYQTVINDWQSHTSGGALNVSNTTFSLTAESLNCDCLKEIHLTDASPFRSRHTLTSAVLKGTNARLVNPGKGARSVEASDPDVGIAKGKTVTRAVKAAFENGLFSLSEIAFDKEHRYAVVAYSFWCGSLCGSGSALVFEKIGSGWRRTDRRCGGWVS